MCSKSENQYSLMTVRISLSYQAYDAYDVKMYIHFIELKNLERPANGRILSVSL